jgi:hypothetical protein
MRKLTLTQMVPLDGVVRSPDGPAEKPSGGFTKGGWLLGPAGGLTFGSTPPSPLWPIRPGGRSSLASLRARRR